jgi:hypothetical protein
MNDCAPDRVGAGRGSEGENGKESNAGSNKAEPLFHKILDASNLARLRFPVKDGQAELDGLSMSGAKQNAPDSVESWDVC